MTDQVTRTNHYVPMWYQRGFLDADQSLYHLDMSPQQNLLPNGHSVTINALHKRAPKSCFCEHDLYSTYFGNVVNDEVEKYLFGSIDDRGAKAVRAFASGDPSAMHDSFQDFFEYMDAQKLRTPKGLDWIKSHYSALDQQRLMREMQGLRFIHCTMWTEGVREIVSAANSDVKFLVTDHPVTVYNAALPPQATECKYPDDPSIELIGTQTVFALDANTCLILTHLENAKEPKPSSLTAQRTNARYRGKSIVRTDAFIRTRKLSRDDVITVNHLLKSRARRYVAASNKDWLHPEKYFVGEWKDIAKVLLPRDELWQFGGEIYVGHNDGSSQYQDAFGRTSGVHKYLQRKNNNVELRPNDSCGCGSGRKFKLCCKDLPVTGRPSWQVYGIRERNLMFCGAVKGILGLIEGKTWDDVRRELSDDQVTRIHDAFGSLWPEDTDLTDLLPRPVTGVLRLVYLGVSDPRTVERTVLGWLPYFDEVVLAHPFLNPVRMKPEFSPTKSPAQHRAQTLKNVLLLLILEPYIRSGYVHLIPDPVDFNAEFGTSVLQMAQERTSGLKPDRQSTRQLEALTQDDHRRLLFQLPEDSRRQSLRNAMPTASDEEIDAAIAEMESELAEDPFALLQEIVPGEAGAQLTYIKGYSLETAMYLAGLTGAGIYTDIEVNWQQLHMHAIQADQPAGDTWVPVVESMRAVNFLIDINPETLYKIRRAGRFGGIRSTMRLLAAAMRQAGRQPRQDQLAIQITRAAQTMNGEWAHLPGARRLIGQVELSVPRGGFVRNDVQRLLLTFGRTKSVRPIPFAMLVKFEELSAGVF